MNLYDVLSLELKELDAIKQKETKKEQSQAKFDAFLDGNGTRNRLIVSGLIIGLICSFGYMVKFVIYSKRKRG